MTSKSVKNGVDNLRPPAIVRLSRSFLDNMACCKRERLLHILTELEKLTSRCRITILDLGNCDMRGKDAGRLAGVLAQCPSLSRLYLHGNQLGSAGAGLLAGVLPQCPALSLLTLEGHNIGDQGAGMLAGELAQCPALSALHLGDNGIGDQGAERFAKVLPQGPALYYLNLTSTPQKSHTCKTHRS